MRNANFMQISVFLNPIKKIESNQRFVSAVNYPNEYHALDILYIFVHSTYSCNITFSISVLFIKKKEKEFCIENASQK